MFATLLGSLPRPPLADDAAPEALLDAVLELQVEHGLEPLTDAGWGLDSEIPWPHGRRPRRAPTGCSRRWSTVRTRGGRAAAEVRVALVGLADAGCRGSRSTSRAPRESVRSPTIVPGSWMRARRSRPGSETRCICRSRSPVATRTARASTTSWRAPFQPGAGSHRGTGQLAARDEVAGRTGPDLRRTLDAGRERRRPGATALGCPIWGLDPWTGSCPGRAGNRRVPGRPAMVRRRREGATARRGRAAGGGPRDERLSAIDPRAVDKRSAALGRYEPDADGPAGRRHPGSRRRPDRRPKARVVGERCGPDRFT